MSVWTKQEIDTAINEIAKKAAMDREFRKKVLSHPNEAVKQITGKEIPEGYKIKVLEADPEYDQTFVLPPAASEDLTDEELEKVAGGACAGDISACLVAVR